MKFKFKYMNNIVYGFVLIAVGLLSVFVAIILINNKTFTKTHSYYTILNDAAGLANKPAIYFRGFEIGRIDEFDLNDENKIRVSFYIYDDYKSKVVQNSVIAKSSSITGEVRAFEMILPIRDTSKQMIEIETGSFIPALDSEIGQRYLRDGIIRVAKDDISGIIVSLNEILAGLVEENNENQGAMFKTIENLRSMSQNLEEFSSQMLENKTSSRLGQAIQNIGDLAKSMTETTNYVNKTINQLDSTIAAYKNPDGLATKMGGTTFGRMLSNMDTSLVYVKNTLRSVDQSRQEIGLMMYNINLTLERMQKTLQGLNNNPLLRGGISNEKEKFGVEID